MLTRRDALVGSAAMLASCTTWPSPFATPHKLGRLVLGPSGQGFDSQAIDCPFVFTHDGMPHMTYLGFDGVGYQTGLASSRNLIDWHREGVILPRDPNDPVARFNVAAASILRENELYSPGRLIKVAGRFVAVYHAYPGAGYEAGPAVIGLAFSKDLRTWTREAPFLFPHDGAEWERGGLYKPFIALIGDTFHVFYNAKTEGETWHEQIGVVTSRDLKNWTRHSGNPIIRNGWGRDARFAADPFVVSHRGQWALFYYGLSRTGQTSELVAVGSPLDWTKTGEVLIESGAAESIDAKYAHKPAMFYSGGDLHHYYCAVDASDRRGITVARSRAWA